MCGAKNASAKMMNEQVKERVIKDVSGSLDIRVAVRKTRSGIVVETVSEREMKKITECVKFTSA